jgi:hypothetical protein
MLNPILRICAEVNEHNLDRTEEINIYPVTPEIGKRLSFCFGYAEGIIANHLDMQIPIVVENYQLLDDGGKKAAMKMLNALHVFGNGKVSKEFSGRRIMAKLEALNSPPRVVIYAIRDSK